MSHIHKCFKFMVPQDRNVHIKKLKKSSYQKYKVWTRLLLKFIIEWPQPIKQSENSKDKSLSISQIIKLLPLFLTNKSKPHKHHEWSVMNNSGQWIFEHVNKYCFNRYNSSIHQYCILSHTAAVMKIKCQWTALSKSIYYSNVLMR